MALSVTDLGICMMAFGTCGLIWLVTSWLIGLEEPKGKHHKPRTTQVRADIDQETVEIFRTMNRPPDKFFAGPDEEPDWADDIRTWKFDTSSLRALRVALDELDQAA
jgi:hypothetical protein